VSKYLDDVKVGDRYEAEPARTTPLPPREDRPSEPERFTVGKAIGNGVGGALIGLLGGALLAGVVLGVAALVARRVGGRS
jgi:predicted lipid-binding transport protein (Tim44 family)